MKTVTQMLIVLLLTIESLASEENQMQNVDSAQIITSETVELERMATETAGNSFKNAELEIIPIVTSGTCLNNTELKENISQLSVLESNKIYADEKGPNPNESDLIQIVLKDVTHLEENQEQIEAAKNFTKYLVKISTEPLATLEATQSSNLTESELLQIVLKDAVQLTNNPEETKQIVQNSNESLIAADATTVAEHELIGKSLNNLNASQNSSLAARDSIDSGQNFAESLVNTTSSASSNFAKTDLVQVANLTNNKTESLVEVDTTATTAVEDNLSRKPSISLEIFQNLNLDESELIKLLLNDVRISTVKQKEINDTVEITTDSLSEAESTTTSSTSTAELELTTKFSISLEEYAVKQMNFILDHLLIETQEFVAKVLQATINSVFPRDQLKLYAEGLNNILNPDTGIDYSAEDIQIASQDETYDLIVQKLNFLKSKPSKFLQRHLPQDWINEYRNKRAELSLWLDKATEQMHTEFNCYITEEEDYIKYKYFNETFDDISRATEIHHKLALLADLVKIVKNKKQITFMDLYMQS